jgi:hypothetical protein
MQARYHGRLLFSKVETERIPQRRQGAKDAKILRKKIKYKRASEEEKTCVE